MIKEKPVCRKICIASFPVLPLCISLYIDANAFEDNLSGFLRSLAKCLLNKTAISFQGLLYSIARNARVTC